MVAVLGADVEVRDVDGADRAALLTALADADAVLIRSATQVDAEALAAAPRLKVVARAGIGLDNVDVPAATARGVMVVNAPQSNVVSAAEQAVALLLACARNTASANAALKAGPLGAQPLDRRRGGGQDRRRRRAGPHRRAVRPADVGVRHPADRVRPVRQPGPGRPDRRPAGAARRAAARERLHLDPPAEDARDGRADRRGRSSRLCKPTRADHQRGPRRAGRRGGAGQGARRRARSPAPGIDVFETEPCTDSPLFAFD